MIEDAVESSAAEGSADASTEVPGVSIVDEFNHWLDELAQGSGSDLHIKVGSPPKIREAGRLRRIERDVLLFPDTEALARATIPDDRKAVFLGDGEVNFAYSVSGVGRFRVNAFRQRGSVSMVFRKLRYGGPSFEESGLPAVVQELAHEPRGLVLVTGPTGSGKTTTLAAMIETSTGRVPRTS